MKAPINDNGPLDLKPVCIHLRHKMMYADERHEQIGLVDDSSDTRVFLCMKSQEAIGPDGEPVMPTTCQPGRGCCERS